MSPALNIFDFSRVEVFNWSQDAAKAEAYMGGMEVCTVSAKLMRPPRSKNTYSNLMRFQSFFRPIGSNRTGVECLAIRWSGANGDKEKLALPVVYTITFPQAVVGSMPMLSFLLAKGCTQ